MHKEYCSKCRKLVNTFSTTDLQEEIINKTPILVTWVSYYCHTCRLFIRVEKEQQKTDVVS